MQNYKEEFRSQKLEVGISSQLQIRQITNYTNSTNKVKRFIIFYVKEIYIVNSFVIFVLFVVKKMVVGGGNKKLYVFCSFFFSRGFK